MVVLNIDSNIGIKKIKKFQSDLLAQLSEEKEIALNFKDVRRLDLSTVQLIISAFEYAKSIKKRIKLLNVSDDIKKQLTICGLIK